MELGLGGKIAIVTGGASNIGREIALSLAREGSQVVVADIDVPQGEKVVAQARAAGNDRVICVGCDVTKRADADRVLVETERKFGPVDILINNVGWAEHKLFIDKDWDMAEREVAINFWGSLYLTKVVLPSMIERKAGRIICVSSDAGRAGEYRETIYSAAKAGVMGFVRTLAKEVGKYSITVNGICPSMTIPETMDDVGERSMHHNRNRPPEMMEKILKLYPLRRVGKPADVANLAVFLSSDAASFITGQNVSVNGGFLV